MEPMRENHLKSHEKGGMKRPVRPVRPVIFRSFTNGSPVVKSVQREKGPPRGRPIAGCDAPQPLLLLPVSQEAGDPLTDGGGRRELGQLLLEDWDGGV